MAYPLLPSIADNQLSIAAMLNSPTKVNGVLAKLTADRLILGDLFSPLGGTVSGGGLLYNVLKDGLTYSARDVEERMPGAEYLITYGDAEYDLAKAQDWGSKVEILDEQRDRNDVISLANSLAQQANTIARKLDQLAIGALEQAFTKWSIAGVPGHDWGTLTTVGPLDDITPNAGRPTADFANANLLAQVDDIGIGVLDTLILHPQQQAALQIGYGTDLAAVLASAGITTVKTSLNMTNGTGYLLQAGKVGRVAFERPLTTETIDDRHHRSTWLQTYVVPLFAVSTPGAARKITGLAG